MDVHPSLQNIATMLTSQDAKWTITYYNERLEADIDKLPGGVRGGCLRLFKAMKEHGANLRMPHSRAMGDGLFELRPRGQEGIGRVFYCTMIGKRIIILHAFVKKTQETPINELRIAHSRMKEIKTRG
jgi:phage-related protein